MWSISKESKSSSATLNHGHYSASATLNELKNAPYAIEELYKVIKEAENFLHICSDPKFWWRGEAIAIAVTTEAHDVHIHDLMWCIAGLKLALQTSRKVGLESRAQFTRLNIAQCYAEMASLSSQGSQWIRKEDCASLLLVLQQMSGKYKKMSFIKKNLINNGEKKKHDTVQFLLQKLDSTSSCGKQPQPSMHICSQELTFPPRPHLLGQGSFASVFEASWLGIKVAVKQFGYPARKESFEREAAILVKLQSPFIIQLFGQSVDKQKNTCYLVMELVKTNLATLVEERMQLKKPLRLPVLLDLMLQISRAMEYLHSKKIMHRDLKPSNILVEPLSSSENLMQKGYGRVKLCDFGSAKVNRESCDMTSRVGTKGYRAPEVLSLRDGSEVEWVGYSFEADVYSFGMTISYCLTGEEPFADIKSVNRLVEMVKRGDRPELPAASCPLLLKELIQKCWSGDPSSRPSFASITMTLRHLKLLLMKARPPLQLSEYSEVKEFMLSTPVISYTELSVATCDFTRRGKNITLDSMFHGVLSDGTNVLVQCIQNVIDSKKIWVKISQMLNLRHRNIARLRAVCTHSSKCWFIYEYTYVQGSLDRWLEGGKLQEALDTTSCYRIAVGAAFGLQYLHAQHTVFLVRSENILLDDQFEPQILIDLIECEERDNNLNHLQRNDVLHFGKLISKLLCHMINNGLDLDTTPNKSEVSMLKKVESLCQSSKDVRMDEIVEMLESVYETYHEESLQFDPCQRYLLNFSGSFVDKRDDTGEMLESQYEIHSDDSLQLDPNLFEFNGRI